MLLSIWLKSILREVINDFRIYLLFHYFLFLRRGMVQHFNKIKYLSPYLLFVIRGIYCGFFALTLSPIFSFSQRYGLSLNICTWVIYSNCRFLIHWSSECLLYSPLDYYWLCITEILSLRRKTPNKQFIDHLILIMIWACLLWWRLFTISFISILTGVKEWSLNCI